ncbi:MAG: glycoside hydrolase family 13 protein [Clostridia bacterium]|nr:glycoside hydrolase family 13 protein [Clostridia bacterium]
MINRKALFADETENFKTPYEPMPGDRVTLKLRTLKNDVLQAYALVNGIKRKMEKIPSKDEDGNFDFYQMSFTCTDKAVNYYFVVYDDDDKVSYNRLGCVENVQSEYDFCFTPGFKVPDWAKGTVFYQIFTDRFCNGDFSNDVCDNEYYYTGGHSKRITEWNKFPDELDVRCFYGGDLQGVRQKLDYLQDLGVEAIYFNPLFVSPSNHKYDTQDYDHIDPHLAVIEEDMDHAMQYWEKNNGYAPKYIKRTTSRVNLEKSNEYFASLVKEIHSRGMRVVIDGVFNHCGSFNKWLDREGIYLNKDGYEKGAFQAADSPYRSYFKFKKPNEAKSEYEGWWDFPTLPKLNYEKSAALEEYILSTGSKWVSEPYNVDGWRLDVAADLGHSPRYNHKFWQMFRDRVRKANPEAFIFAEQYGDPVSWFNGKEWDSVMNYDAFMEPVTWFLTGMEKHSEAFDGGKLWDGNDFFESMFKCMSRFPRPSLDSALNQLSNHDHSRFLTRTNGMVGTLKTMGPHSAADTVDTRVMSLAVLIQMTWPGSPGIYYADEAGQVGWTDPDCRRTYPWGQEDEMLLSFHKSAIALRKNIHCLKMGSVKKLDAGNGYIIYGRFDKEDCAAVVINCTDGDLSLSVPVWEIGVPAGAVMTRKMFCGDYNFTCDEQDSEVKHGRLFVSLPAKSGCVYTYSFNKE